MQKTNFSGVFEQRKGKFRQLYTKNLLPGKTVYEEKLFREGGAEYREWNPTRSKLGAAILKGIKEIGMKQGDTVLYLGAAYGTTPSHVSDIVGNEGFVFCVDFAPRVMRSLVFLCEDRKNMTPLLFDANQPQQYKDKVMANADIVYQDVAQRNQAEIFLKNCDMFLKKGGYGLGAVKARSIDVTKSPRQVYDEFKRQIEKKLRIIDFKILDPFEKDHCFFVCKKG